MSFIFEMIAAFWMFFAYAGAVQTAPDIMSLFGLSYEVQSEFVPGTEQLNADEYTDFMEIIAELTAETEVNVEVIEEVQVNIPEPEVCVANPGGPEERPCDAPNLCEDATIDTITRTQDGRTYVFKGEYFWEYCLNGLAYPKKISDDWGCLEGDLDAALTEPDGFTYFFKGAQCWKYRNKVMESGYPKPICEVFPGIPDDVDTAFTWTGDNMPYIFKGNQFWLFDRNCETPIPDGYPKFIYEVWRGLPVNDITAAFVYADGFTYFLVGGGYYQYDDKVDAVAEAHPPYPHSIGTERLFCKKKCDFYPTVI